jgi:hypothetical protein
MGAGAITSSSRSSEQAALKVKTLAKRGWRKYADRPLGEVIASNPRGLAFLQAMNTRKDKP